MSTNHILEMVSQIVGAYVSNNPLPSSELPDLIHTVYGTLSNVGVEQHREEEKPHPAVSIKKSITPDFIICLEDGKKLKMLKRHLRTTCNMTPEEYRKKWNLPADYPMVAPNYANQRSEFAKNIGLGKKAETVQVLPAKKSRKKKGGAEANA